nr:MAG TPA: hypothetical protein [Caudoviricetes sp.]
MEIKVNGKWYELSWFDDFEEIEMIGEIEETKDVPDGIDIETNWDEIQEYLGLSGLDQQIVMACYEATNVFNPDEAMEAYAGSYTTGAEFAQTLSEELGYIPEALPSWIAYHIDWQTVWDCELHYDYFESNGHYFRNL